MKKLIVSATAAIFAAGSAFAQLPVKPSASPEEIQEKLQARAKAENTFNGFDTDHNGSLSEEEYLAALQKMMRQLAEQIKSSVQNMSETE